MFLSTLSVKHIEGKHWAVTQPLLWKGKWQLFVIRAGFETDFASIPIMLRWLLDNAGANSEAAVLHDAVWRESKRKVDPEVDPADADGIFRSALRQTGATALTRGLMWFGVRTIAIFGGRYGKAGPPRWVKLGQILGMLVLGLVAAGVPTLVVIVGLGIYWVANWIVALVWQIFERRRFPGFAPNWPWPFRKERPRPGSPRDEYLELPPPRRFFHVVDLNRGEAAHLIELAEARQAQGQEVTDAEVGAVLDGR
jgi:Protein of unknown function (DUF1353)